MKARSERRRWETATLVKRAQGVMRESRKLLEQREAQLRQMERFVVRADEKLTAFLELQPAIHGFAVTVSQGECFNDRRTGFASDEVHRI